MTRGHAAVLATMLLLGLSFALELARVEGARVRRNRWWTSLSIGVGALGLVALTLMAPVVWGLVT